MVSKIGVRRICVFKLTFFFLANYLIYSFNQIMPFPSLTIIVGLVLMWCS